MKVRCMGTVGSYCVITQLRTRTTDDAGRTSKNMKAASHNPYLSVVRGGAHA